MNNEKPLVSVFIPYYNDEKFLNECIESVLRQTYKNFELILLDHASTDNCSKIAHSFNDLRIKHIHMTKNTGGGGGLLLAECLKVATGKYIKLFCADDVLLEQYLEKMVNYMEENPEKDFAFSNVQYVDVNLNHHPDDWFSHRKGFNLNISSVDILHSYFNLNAFLPFVSCFIKREKLNFPTDKFLIMLFDCSLWVNLLINGCECGFVDEILALYRIHEGQMSAVSNEELSHTRGELEVFIYFQLFEKITDFKIIKKLLEKWDFIQSLEAIETEFISFMFNYYYTTYGITPQVKYLGRCKLHEMIQEDEFRMKLEKKFNFGIETLRNICVDDPVYIRLTKDTKVTSFDLHALSVGKLSRLLFGKIWKNFTSIFKYQKINNVADEIKYSL